MRKRVFCWVPTPVHLISFWRAGFKWFDFAYLDTDGKRYVTQAPLEVDFDALLHGKKAA